MTDFGVTPDGFVLKPVDVILSESLERARAVFDNVDLSSTSPLRKILETTAAEDGELWKRMEDLYYANFVSTASGDNLDLLGEDVGLARPQLAGTGTVHITLGGSPAQGRRYVVPEGTILVTAAPVRTFGTTATVTLDAATARTADVGVVAFEPGPGGDVPVGAIAGIDPAYSAVFLADFGAATLTVTNPAATSGGTATVPDDVYRARLAGLARNLWTVESVTQAALGVSGVLDVVLSDPLGGVDVSQSYFGTFTFDQRAFSAEARRVGEPYFFDVVVAHDVRAPWRTIGSVQGVFERVRAAVDLVRPVGIHPNIVEADHIEVGARAILVVEPGSDGAALLASIRQRLATDIGSLRLGGDVLYSQVVRAFVEQPGAVDVQQLHLRRNPPAFGRITFGAVTNQSTVVETPVGENLAMGRNELAIFPTREGALDIALVTP
ncbi:baseplate J/gp47 family protein [Streptomyces sp. H10-C2]|uniref:baseplate J/gp47 family protein n=1 Tax=unclassified Streptomyces TaxID=2593676 RepID=UPI0024BA3C4E|nr:MULTISPECIES: baseplate J/gp47 family protein [unclassified Streptomyces]MDJ0343464.1 baseplate J/gp47 family protein [Streptomyces sp. PH10-H1]MDJ0371544.1 baseplate J/gp47 family protein [Streptomyces sp. H10-C2]